MEAALQAEAVPLALDPEVPVEPGPQGTADQLPGDLQWYDLRLVEHPGLRVLDRQAAVVPINL